MSDYDDYESAAEANAAEREHELKMAKDSIIQAFLDLMESVSWVESELGINLHHTKSSLTALMNQLPGEFDDAVSDAAMDAADSAEFYALSYGSPP